MKIALVNRLDNRFTVTLAEGLRRAGHNVVVVAPDGPTPVPAGRLEEAIEGTDLVLSCWADAVTSRLSRRRDIRLVTFVRGDEVMTPGTLGEIDWAQKAFSTGDLNFRWFPPPAEFRWKPLTLLVNQSCDTTPCPANGCAGNLRCSSGICQDGSALTYWRGCPPGLTAIGNHGSQSICIQLCSNRIALATSAADMINTRVTTADGRAFANTPVGPDVITNIFHEVGHAVAFKYTDGSRPQEQDGACDERDAFDETVADMFAVVVALQEFPPNRYPWMSHATGSFRTPAPHLGPGTRLCHGLVPHRTNPPPAVVFQPAWRCDESDRRYGDAMEQAFWDFSHSVDCTGGFCFALRRGSIDHNRWAFFFAIMGMTKSQRLPYSTLASWLTLYYFVEFEDWDAFADRLRLFQRYNLMGPDFFESTSDCDGVVVDQGILVSSLAPPDGRRLAP